MYGRIGLFCIWNELLLTGFAQALYQETKGKGIDLDEKPKMRKKNRIIPAEVLFWRRGQCKLPQMAAAMRLSCRDLLLI